MPNGKYILNDLEFEKELKAMSPDDKIDFIARLSYSNAIRITSLEGRYKRLLSIAGGVSLIISGVVASVVKFFIGG